MEVARLVMMMKTTADSKSMGRTLGTRVTYVVNSCQGKVARDILYLNKLNASICSGIGCDKSS